MNLPDTTLTAYLAYLRLHAIHQHYPSLADQPSRESWTHVQYLSRLVQGEALARMDRATDKPLRLACLPVAKTLEHFDWSYPKRINRAQVQNLFHVACVNDQVNVVFLGGVGSGTMPATGLCRVTRGFLLRTRL